MTTPNPSRSVSPEPTKGEALTAEAWVNDRWEGLMQGFSEHHEGKHDNWDRDPYDCSLCHLNLSLYTEAVETRSQSAYIPLVEAARALAEYMGENASPSSAWSEFLAALVQVPGQQQAEQDGVGGVG